ncbi:uncharacterized protein LOC135818814 [Sycon ciliatum]|uniref:uncharacterized protein LOC135818814 n=1 Tax=Sycon ciliatum TaxID=27933 RepID=UPI0031F65C3F
MASRWSIFHLMALIWWTRLATCTCMSAANRNETSGGSRSSNSAGTAVGITLTMLILIGGGVAVAWLFKTGRLTMERIRTTAEDALAMIRSRLGRKEGENIGQQRDSSPNRGGRAPGQIEDCSYASIGAEAIPSAPPVPSSSLSSAADGSGPPPWARHVSGHAPAAPALPDGDYLMPVEEKMKFQSEATARRESKAVSDSYTPENEYLAPVEELRRAQDRYTASPISAAVRKTPKTERYAGSGLPALPSRPGDHTYDLPERRLYQFAPDA